MASSGVSPTLSYCRLAEGVAEVQIMPKGADEAEAEILTFSQHLACPQRDVVRRFAPRNFSFNSPYGACETRRVPDDLRGRSRARRAEPQPLAERGHGRTVGSMHARSTSNG